jgi:hypothetical protein
MKFDLSKSFEDNLATFRKAAEAIDADCAKILFDNLEKLQASGDARTARATFNKAVKDALDALPDPPGEET